MLDSIKTTGAVDAGMEIVDLPDLVGSLSSGPRVIPVKLQRGDVITAIDGKNEAGVELKAGDVTLQFKRPVRGMAELSSF